MSVRVRINSNQFLREAKKAVGGVSKERYRECGPEIGEEFVQICTPFVPYRDGILAGSGDTTMEGDSIRVHWAEEKKGYDIAHMMYYDDDGSGEPDTKAWGHTPPQTSYWAETAMTYEGDTFRARCESILNGK